MSTVGQNAQQLQQDIQHELSTANQLLRQISEELQVIKIFTNPGGEFESNIKHNASLISTLATLQNIDLQNIPPMVRKHIDTSNYENLNKSYEEHNTFRNESDMDDSQ